MQATILSLAWLALLGACLTLVSGQDYKIYDTNDVCTSTELEPFEALGQLQLLITEPTHATRCPAAHLVAVAKFKDLVDSNARHAVCGPATGASYLAVSLKPRVGQPALPKLVDQFSRDFGQGIVANCKLSLLDNARRLDKQLDDRLLQPIKRLEQAGALLFKPPSSANSQQFQDTDVMRVAYKVSRLFDSSAARFSADQKLLQADTLAALQHFEYMCKKVYRPLLQQMVGSIHDLLLLGHDNTLAEQQREEFNSDPSVGRWLSVYVACEFTKDSPMFKLAPKPDVKRLADRAIMSWTLPKLPSRQMPDRLEVADEQQRSMLKALSKKSELGADKLVEQIHSKLLEENVSIVDESSSKSDTKFWSNYLRYIDNKLN